MTRLTRDPEPCIGNSKLDEKNVAAWAATVEREMRAMFATKVPTPKEVAYRIPLAVAEALITALPRSDGYVVSADVAKLLRPWGLCEAGTKKQRYCLSNHGRAVLVEIRGDFGR